MDLSGCINIENVYFDGTTIKGCSLPNGGILKVLHFPSSVANITILNQKHITDFTCPSFANVSTLRVENCSGAVDTAKIVKQMQNTGRVRLIGIDWSLDSTDILDKLLGMKGMTETGINADKPVLHGSVHFVSLPISKLVEYENVFPYLSITADMYVNDVLLTTPEAVLMDSEGDLVTMADGGYKTTYSDDQIEAFIDAVQEQMAAIESASGT